jgi:hypothetical protein
MCVWKWQAIDSEEMKDFDGLLSFLYGFLVLCSSSFSFVEFVESCCAVFFETISQLPSLTVSEFTFFVQLGRPPLFGSKYAVRRGLGLVVFQFCGSG